MVGCGEPYPSNGADAACCAADLARCTSAARRPVLSIPRHLYRTCPLLRLWDYEMRRSANQEAPGRSAIHIHVSRCRR